MINHLSATVIVLATIGAAQVHAEGEWRDAKPLDNAEGELDVAYLPDRVVGAWQDRWVKLHVHWPQGAKPGQRLPCIVFVHGGGYGGGDFNAGFCGKAMQKAVDAGFAVANLNYILGRDIFPQVFYDYRAAIRHLRANAEAYHIDPQRMGTWGFSAGGWLTSSGNFTDAGDVFVQQRGAISVDWPADHELRGKYERFLTQPDKDGSIRLAVPMDDPHPLHAEHSARIQAHQGDFNHYEQNITPDAPAIMTYVGKGGVSKLREYAQAAGADFTELVLEHPKKKFDGAAAVHVPPLDMEAPTPDGAGVMPLDERVLAWFRDKLIDNPVAPVPEFRPNQRLFSDAIEARVIVPGDGVSVHCTTDGSTPTTSSPKWTGPMKLTDTTTLKAIAVVEGFKPSGVATAVFTKVAPEAMPPVITGPAGAKLPVAKVGRPYSVTFGVEGGRKAVWKLIAHHRPENHRTKASFGELSGLSFDAATGTLSGTPTEAFVYTLHVQAAWEAGGAADARTWVLKVEP